MNNKPTFSALKDNKRVESLIHCFMMTAELDSRCLPTNILATNGQIYEAIYNELTIPSPATGIFKMKVIISFQKHDYGNFAAIRNYSQRRNPNHSDFSSIY